MKLIEDCSPYYIRFEFDKTTDIIEICNNALANDTFDNSKWLKLDLQRSKSILSLMPFSAELNLNPNRVMLFVTEPNGGSDIHKDSLDHRVSFNIGIKILDHNCITRWWSDEDMKQFELRVIDTPNMKSRYISNPDFTNIKPIKTRVASQGEFILFNTDIYHNWDNSKSCNERIVLTLRSMDPANLYFDDAKRILLKHV